MNRKLLPRCRSGVSTVVTLAAILLASTPRVAADEVVDRIPVGLSPFDIAVNTRTNLIYVTNNDSDNLSVIDGRSDQVVVTLPMGDEPRAQPLGPGFGRPHPGPARPHTGEV